MSVRARLPGRAVRAGGAVPRPGQAVSERGAVSQRRQRHRLLRVRLRLLRRPMREVGVGWRERKLKYNLHVDIDSYVGCCCERVQCNLEK